MADLERALRNAHNAGDEVAARRIAAMIKKSREEEQSGFLDKAVDFVTGESRTTPQLDAIPEIGSAPELNRLSVPAFKASLGLLAAGDTASLKGVLSQQFGEGVSFDEDSKGNTIVNLPSGSYALNKPGLSGQDLAQGAFTFGAFTPAGRAASIPGAVGGAAVTQAAIEGAEQSTGGDASLGDVVEAGLLGGFFKGAEELIGAGYRALKGSPQSDVIESAKDAGIPALTTDVIPPETFAGRIAQQTGEKVPFAGTGGVRETQQQAREKAVTRVAEKYGQFSYPSIVGSLKEKSSGLKNKAGNVLERVGNQLDDLGEIDLTNTRAAIARARDDLNKPGVIKSEGALDDLNVLVNTLDEAPQTFTSLKENRTAFREIVKGADKAERSQLTSRAKTLLRNVETAMKKDMNKQAKANLTPQEFNRWNRANRIYFDEAQKLTKSRLKNVLDRGDVTPESVQTLLFSQNPSEVKTLYQSLTNEGRAHARTAIVNRVLDTLSRRQGGITPNSFASEMKKQGLQVDTFFKGEEKKQLKGLLEVLNATRRAQDAATTTPTGQAVLGAGTGYAAFTDPVTTLGAGGTLGGLSRLYESAPVRNALLRLASVPKGSTKFDQALDEAQSALSAAAQTVRNEQSDKQ